MSPTFTIVCLRDMSDKSGFLKGSNRDQQMHLALAKAVNRMAGGRSYSFTWHFVISPGEQDIDKKESVDSQLSVEDMALAACSLLITSILMKNTKVSIVSWSWWHKYEQWAQFLYFSCPTMPIKWIYSSLFLYVM